MNDDDAPCGEVGDAADHRDHHDRHRDDLRGRHWDRRKARRGRHRAPRDEVRHRSGDHQDACRDDPRRDRRDDGPRVRGRDHPGRAAAGSACPTLIAADREAAGWACPKATMAAPAQQAERGVAEWGRKTPRRWPPGPGRRCERWALTKEPMPRRAPVLPRGERALRSVREALLVLRRDAGPGVRFRWR